MLAKSRITNRRKKYATRKKSYSYTPLVALVSSFILSGSVYLYGMVTNDKGIGSQPVPVVQAEMLEQSTMTIEIKNVTVVPAEEEKAKIVASDKEDIKRMIRDAFPEDPETAVAVAMSESSLIPTKTLFASKGKHSWTSETYKGECSVGLFMVNLRENNCTGKLVHWDKVPGETLEEKIEWLKVPENNISIARNIYDSRGGFSAWSAYSGGGYTKWIGKL